MLTGTAGRDATPAGRPRARPRHVVGLLVGAMDRICILRVIGLCARRTCQRTLWAWGRRTVPNTNIDDRIVSEVLVSADDGVAVLVLEADTGAACLGRIETVEVLDGGDDGLSGVVRVYLHPHWYARSVLVRVLDQFEFDGAGDGRRSVLGLDKLHGAGFSSQRCEDVCFRGSWGCVTVSWACGSDRTGMCSGGDVGCGRLCRHQTRWCHSWANDRPMRTITPKAEQFCLSSQLFLFFVPSPVLVVCIDGG